MIRTAFAAAMLLVAEPAAAQCQQERIDARYDRALAAGYKALMLCSAIAHAEANGTTRTPQSVAQWELTGIQAPLDGIVGELPYEIARRPTGQIAHVTVTWVDGMPARMAAYHGSDTGCSVLPIGATPDATDPPDPVPVLARQQDKAIGRVTIPAAGDTVTPLNSLGQVFQAALGGAYGEGSRTTAALVRFNQPRGDLVEQSAYAPGFDDRTPQRTWSVAKSIAATLVGAAVQAGDASVDDSVGINYRLAAGPADMRNTITIDHALRMATGRYSDTPGNRTDPLYWGGSTVDETAAQWPVLHPPGTVFRYANNDTLIAVKAIKPWLDVYPPAELFAKLGMNETVAETDWQGSHILSSQVWTTARDLATFGQLYLNDGTLEDGTRILPEGWSRYVASPSGPQPNGPFGYGAGFWLMNKSNGVPPDTFAAFGNRGQFVVIVPSRDVVIVRRGEDPVGSGFDIAAFARDVLAALEAR